MAPPERATAGHRFLILALALVAVDLIGLGRDVEIEPQPPDRRLRTRGGHRLSASRCRHPPHRHGHPLLAAERTAIVRSPHVGGVFNPLQLANHTIYVGAVGYRGSPVYNLTGIKYIVADKTEPPGDTTFIVPVFADDARSTST